MSRIAPEGVPDQDIAPADGARHIPAEHYINTYQGRAGHTCQTWLFTLDHKRIAILYLVSVTLMFFVGGLGALIVRLNLLSPHGAIVAPQTYNRMFSMHGVVMVFFFLVPVIPAVLGNFFIPMMLGAKDLAFPVVNLLSWYLYVIGALIGISAMTWGGVDTGWTFYTPLSTLYAYDNVALTIVGIFLAGFSSILTGLNFIITVHKMRAPGLTWF